MYNAIKTKTNDKEFPYQNTKQKIFMPKSMVLLDLPNKKEKKKRALPFD